MDPVVLQLLAQLSSAKGGNKNLSALLGNIDNPLLLAMAGVIDPQVMQQSESGGLYGSFQQDPNTPATVQQVMDWVDQGLNKYQIAAQLNNIPDEIVANSGYTKSQLTSIAGDLAKERASGGGKSVFEKAGFRSPNDIYGLMDVPLSAGAQQKIYDLQTQYGGLGSAVSAAEQGSKKAALLMRGASPEVRSDWLEKIRRARPRGTRNTAELRVLEDWVKSTPYATVEELKKRAAEITDSYSYDKTRVGRVNKAVEGIAKSAAPYQQKSVDRAQAIQDWEKAKAAESQAEVQASNNARLQEAIRMASLKNAAQAGRTPFTDQVSTLLKFVAGSK